MLFIDNCCNERTIIKINFISQINITFLQINIAKFCQIIHLLIFLHRVVCFALLNNVLMITGIKKLHAFIRVFQIEWSKPTV